MAKQNFYNLPMQDLLMQEMKKPAPKPKKLPRKQAAAEAAFKRIEKALKGRGVKFTWNGLRRRYTQATLTLDESEKPVTFKQLLKVSEILGSKDILIESGAREISDSTVDWDRVRHIGVTYLTFRGCKL